jgi:hypothetical protein
MPRWGGVGMGGRSAQHSRRRDTMVLTNLLFILFAQLVMFVFDLLRAGIPA